MGIAQSDTPEADTPKQDGANRLLFVYYDKRVRLIGKKCKALIFGSAVFLVNPNKARHGFSLFLKLSGIAVSALLR